MGKEEKESITSKAVTIFVYIFIMGIICLVIGVFCLVAYDTFTTEEVHITIQGEPVNVVPVIQTKQEYSSEEIGSILFFNVTFDNGESYNIRTHEDIDWTVNSKMILELFRDEQFGEPKRDYWYLEQMIKAPD